MNSIKKHWNSIKKHWKCYAGTVALILIGFLLGNIYALA